MPKLMQILRAAIKERQTRVGELGLVWFVCCVLSDSFWHLLSGGQTRRSRGTTQTKITDH